jgi:hypothetical protein
LLEMLKGTLQGIKLPAPIVPRPQPGSKPAARPDRAEGTLAWNLVGIAGLALLALLLVMAALAA